MYSRVYVEITNICNRNCSFCPGTRRVQRRMTLTEFTTVAEKLRGVTQYIYYHLMGEPLTHPLLPDMIRVACGKGFRSAITTNGTLLPSRGDALIAQSNTQAVRAVFVIDPNGIIRTILYYPLSTGRNFDEIKRIIQALQKADADNCATPADWRPGDDVIVPTAGSCGTAKERMENQNDDQYCLDWFMCFRREKK